MSAPGPSGQEGPWNIMSCIRDTQKHSIIYVCRRDDERQLFLRSTFSLPNVTMDDCMHLALEPSELRLWLHFLLDVTPSNTGENHFIWKTRPGFPYGGVRLTMQHSTTTRKPIVLNGPQPPFAQDDNAMCLCVALVPVDTGNTGGDSTLSLPQIRFFVMPGENNTTSWVMVSEFSAEGILRTLPGVNTYHFLRSYAAYQTQTSLKRLQTRATLLAAGLVPLRRNGLRQMYQSSKQPDFNIGEMMPSFSLLDEMLVRSVIFVDDIQRPPLRRWDVVEELHTSAQAVLHRLGVTDIPSGTTHPRGEDSEYAPGTLTPVMSLLFERCLVPQVRLRISTSASGRKPSMLLIVHSLHNVVEEVRRIEEENYAVTLCMHSSVDSLLAGQPAFNIILCESVTLDEAALDPDCERVLTLCQTTAVACVIVCRSLSRQQLHMYTTLGAATCMLLPIITDIDPILRPLLCKFDEAPLWSSTPSTSSSMADLQHAPLPSPASTAFQRTFDGSLSQNVNMSIMSQSSVGSLGDQHPSRAGSAVMRVGSLPHDTGLTSSAHRHILELCNQDVALEMKRGVMAHGTLGDSQYLDLTGEAMLQSLPDWDTEYIDPAAMLQMSLSEFDDTDIEGVLKDSL